MPVGSKTYRPFVHSLMCLTFRNQIPTSPALRLLFAVLSFAGIASASEFNGIVKLAWTGNPENNISGYRIKYGTTSGSLIQSQTVSWNTTTTSITGLETGQTYYFAVQAYNSSALDGPLSDEVSEFIVAPVVPEISIVQSPSTELTDGQSTGWFGSVAQGSTSAPQSFVIRNLGTSDLSNLSVSIDGVDQSNFSIATDLPLTLLATNNGSFEGAFTSWSQSGNLRVSTNAHATDGTHLAEFNYSNTEPNGVLMQTFATTPGVTYTLSFDVGVLASNTNTQSILTTVTGSGNLLSQTVTVSGTGDSVTRWTSRTHTFVANSTTTTLSFSDHSTSTAAIDLYLDNVRVAPPATAVAPNTVTSLAAGASTTLTATFRPSSAGDKVAYLHISSNDADENPFEIALAGNGLGIDQPEIAIEHSLTGDLTDDGSTVNFINTLTGTTGTPEIFTIRNTGNTNLTGIVVSTSGTNASDFILGSPTVTTLAPGASTTFQIAFHPGASGSRTATIQIASNDADENPLLIALTGNGITFPEIAVERSDSGNVTDAADTVDFSGLQIGSTSAAETLVLRNLGTAPLTDLVITLDGANAADFILDGPAVDSLAPGASATLSLFFAPSASGARTATLHIASSDADESPFDIALTGTGIALLPEIAIERANGTGLTDASASLVFSATSLGTSSAAETLTLRNLGTATLTNLAVALDGASAADFTFDGPAMNSLAPGASVTLNVFFVPTVAGTRNASLRITSNDADENPFDIALTGNSVAFPEIAIERANGTALTDAAASVVFSGITLGTTSAAETFTLRNSGNAALTNLAIVLNGAQASDFTFEGPAVTSLAPGASTTFRVFFKPTAAGARNASISIASNDADENPFDIALTGTGIAIPDISVASGTGNPFPGSPASAGFGDVEIGSTSSVRTFTIANPGTAALTGLGLAVDGAHAGDFLLESTAATSLAPGASTTFMLTFKPTAPGNRTATLHIASNDPDTNPFNLVLSGNAVAVPRIALFRSGQPLATGGEAIHFGNVDLGSVSASEPITIRNQGTAHLTNLTAVANGIFGPDFSISALDASPLAPGAETTFRISFKPSAAGPRSAVLHLASNDSHTGPFNIALTGTGIAFPVMALENAEGSRLQPGTVAPIAGSVIVGATGSPQTFVIRNTGTAALPGLRVSTFGGTASAFLIGTPDTTSLEPGAASTFTVTFKPAVGGTTTTGLRISNSFQPAAPFEIILSGEGTTIPGIDLRNPAGTSLAGGTATENFGNLDLIAAPRIRSFTIVNTGSAPLTGINIVKDGPHAADFALVQSGSATVAPGASTTFTIAFKPGATGTRSASLAIHSNAPGSPLSLALLGKGVAAPEIKVELADKDLKDGGSFINHGPAEIATRGESRTFVISNIGSAPLARLSLAKKGINPADFIVTALKTDTLAPGASTSVTVTFKPTDIGIRWGSLQILSTDANEKPFDIVLTGKGVYKLTPIGKNGKKSQRAKASAPLAAPTDSPVAKGIAVIDGLKYRTLTITRTPGTTVQLRDIQVSSDLVAWSSGANHTTVLRDTATTLTVRDNTPLTPETKRHIRLKP
ncbi:MAG: choice-of-anchor D domain-containing protein [Verrucomicrobiota bacterium]